MLQCPPTRIHLSPADLASFERRFIAKNAMRDAHFKATGLRLNSGPGHLARSGVVRADRNIGRHRAESCVSQATVFPDADEEAPTLPIPTIVTTAAPAALNEPRGEITTSPSAVHSSPSQEGWSISRPSRENVASTAQSQRRADVTGDPDTVPPFQSDLIQYTSTTSRLHDLSSVEATLRNNPPRPARDPFEPRRRPMSREPDKFTLYEDPQWLQLHPERQHLTDYERRRMRHGSGDRGVQEAYQPQLPTRVAPPRYVDTLATAPQAAPLLDPVAPVFVPRMRFGSTGILSADNGRGGARNNAPSQGSGTDNSSNAANLRPRSSFERNSQYNCSRPNRVLATEQVEVTQNRRRNRAHDQNNALPRLTSNLDRYPPLRQPVTAFASRRSSGSQRPVVFPRQRSSRQHLVDYERSLRSGIEEPSAASQTLQLLLTVPDPADERSHRARSVSPVLSSSSRSTPNLLRSSPLPPGPRIHTQSSSLTCNQASEADPHAEQGHARAMADGTDNETSAATSSTLEISAALGEFLLSRNSPLDELTQQLSRLATSRPRSVGRSFERPPGHRNRINLLSGDPFRQDSSPEREAPEEYEGYEVVHPPMTSGPRDSVLSSSSADDDPVALALALPPPDDPLSPTSASSTHLPSTPATYEQDTSSPRLPTTISSAARTSQIMMIATPAGPPAATPRLPIYNDRRAAELQPQTPADLVRSTARRHGRSETVSQRAVVSSALAGSPATVTERHLNRHTFPAAIPSHAEQQQPTANRTTPSRSTAVLEQLPSMTSRRQTAVVRLEQRNSNSSENDVEGGLDGLEEDRRIWMGRMEDGSLNTTPPAEGRFERYLS